MTEPAAYVAHGGTGSDCTYVAPCGNLAAAMSLLHDGGRVYIMTPGYYSGSPVFSNVQIWGIGQATTVEYLDIRSSGVTIRNITLGSLITSSAAFPVGPTVTCEEVSFAGGITMDAGTLNLKDVRFSDTTAQSGRVAVKLQSGSRLIRASLEDVQISGGAYGVLLEATGSAWIQVSIKNSTLAHLSGSAIHARATGGNNRLYLDDITLISSGSGLVASGSKTIAWLGDSVIAGNTNGVLRQLGGVVLSFNDNQIYNNKNDGTPLTQSWTPPAAYMSPRGKSN